MLENLKINELSVLNGTCIFSKKDFKISSVIPNIVQGKVHKDYWYKYDGNVIAPKTILFEGDFSSGKTLIYNLLKYIYEIVVLKKRNGFSFYFDAEISFFSVGKHFDYKIKVKNSKILDALTVDGIKVCDLQDTNKNSFSDRYPDFSSWFEKIIFIPSVYDDSEGYRVEMEKYFDIQKINKLLSVYKSRFQHKSEYIIRLENILNTTRIISMNTFFNTNNILKTSFNNLNQSTIDLLTAMNLIDCVNKSTDQILIIDDVDLISKTRFMTFLHDRFVASPAEKPIQTIAFANKITIKYEGRNLFGPAHKINLENII